MRLEHGKKGSQRKMKPIQLKFFPNWGGQGGTPYITMEGDDGKWYMLHFNGEEEAREMLSQAHIAFHNICDERILDDLKLQLGIRKDLTASTETDGE